MYFSSYRIRRSSAVVIGSVELESRLGARPPPGFPNTDTLQDIDRRLRGSPTHIAGRRSLPHPSLPRLRGWDRPRLLDIVLTKSSTVPHTHTRSTQTQLYRHPNTSTRIHERIAAIGNHKTTIRSFLASPVPLYIFFRRPKKRIHGRGHTHTHPGRVLSTGLPEAEDPGEGEGPTDRESPSRSARCRSAAGLRDCVRIGFHPQHLPGVFRVGTRFLVVGRVVIEGPDPPADIAPAVHHVQYAPVSGRNVQAAAISIPPVQADHLVAVNGRRHEQRLVARDGSHLAVDGAVDASHPSRKQ